MTEPNQYICVLLYFWYLPHGLPVCRFPVVSSEHSMYFLIWSYLTAMRQGCRRMEHTKAVLMLHCTLSWAPREARVSGSGSQDLSQS